MTTDYLNPRTPAMRLTPSDIHMVDKVTTAVTYTAAGGTVILGFTANEFAALGGLAIAVVAFITNTALTLWFKHQHLKLARERTREGVAEHVAE